MKTKKIFIVLQFFCCLSFTSCQKFLDAKPDKKQVILSSLKDCQALLDDYRTMNASFPFDGEVSADNYYLLGSAWLALRDVKDRDTYIWSPMGEHFISQWLNPYKVIYNANLILETLDKLPKGQGQQKEWNEIKGAALFYRAYAFYQVAVLFAQPYKAETANRLPGIPIRLTPDLAFQSERGTLQQTYSQIIEDLKESLELLPTNQILPVRPSKAAAYAALARTYLTMEDYGKAGAMADECLKLKNALINYNDLNLNSAAPMKQFNEEVIFHSVALTATPLAISICKVDPDLMLSYVSPDLRKKAFFKLNTDNSYSFKGNYDGKANGILFNGLTTAEIYLIRAECNARAEDVAGAMRDLNTLMRNRWDKNITYIPFVALNALDALKQVLQERRKELVFRGLRLTDLRRLNSDPRFAISIARKLTIEGVEQTYSLPANDPRYTLLIPELVMQSTNMIQNPRP
ncbi:RagB/SusD family nutrient uptake outer membrane protein [Pedobacter gandavensis]|uniref:RagB/SusD family nutrient uptake outer membrane protein n=1 Tax=Pedobacter gandavensis TaxID=2679963 RepID=UPI00292E8FF2|nr:RagB/SusD family nutrient uptake outer membrane protein [Pedobacter gandavensis]